MLRDFQSPLYKAWRAAVFARDKWCCKWPKCKCRIGIQAHHIKKWADDPIVRFNVRNGITLCRKHHRFIRGREEQYASLFYRLLCSKLL